MTGVSVATWNLHQAVDRRADNIEATWRYVETELRPTVALIQEAAVIPETPGTSRRGTKTVALLAPAAAKEPKAKAAPPHVPAQLVARRKADTKAVAK